MCGIVGYIGKAKPTKFLLQKLSLLEYRGYDSAGYAVHTGSGVKVKKTTKSIAELLSKTSEAETASLMIAHTRWATHGEVSELNSHPHSSEGGLWTIVHNGIIENYEELKAKFNLAPKSDTDTAVIAELLERLNVCTVQEFIDAFVGVSGSYAIAAINKNFPDTLFFAKRKSPLFVSLSAEGALIASDPICFKNFSETYFVIEDNEFGVLTNGEMCVYNGQKILIEKTPQVLDKNFETSEKGDYPTFMLKEIFEEGEVLNSQVNYYKNSKTLDKFNGEFIKNFDSVILVGCGTAYHAACVGAKYFQKILKLNSHAEYASEFIYSPPVTSTHTLFIFVSQSGETADTLRAHEIVKNLGATSISLTNVSYSSLAKASDYVLPVCARAEIAVASTKAYVCQLSALYMLASHFANEINHTHIDFYEDILRVSETILSFDKDNLDNIARKICECQKCIFIGKDLDYITAKEAALKFKETTYIDASSYPSGELKHGYLALIEEGTLVFAFACQKDIFVKTKNSAEEAVCRGAGMVVFHGAETGGLKSVDEVVFSEKNELLSPMFEISPVQYLAAKVSELKGINPDKPRNLAKSVTVE